MEVGFGMEEQVSAIGKTLIATKPIAANTVQWRALVETLGTLHYQCLMNR